jgi:hypothetical protein
MTCLGTLRLAAILCAGILAPATALAGSAIYLPEGGGPAYSYWPQQAPYYDPVARAPKQNLHLYLNAPGNTVRSLDGGRQVTVYDRECRIREEVVPSARGPHRIVVTRC